MQWILESSTVHLPKRPAEMVSCRTKARDRMMLASKDSFRGHYEEFIRMTKFSEKQWVVRAVP